MIQKNGREKRWLFRNGPYALQVFDVLGYADVVIVEVHAAKRLHRLSIELKIHEHPSVLPPGSRDDWPPASLEATWSIALIIPKSSPWNRLYGALLMEQHERWVGTTWLKPEGA